MRLVQVMWMLLQAGESGLTPAELGEVLPIGGRTVLRDIDALENGGIPVQRVWVPVGRDVRRRYVLMLDAHQRAAAARLAVVLPGGAMSARVNIQQMRQRYAGLLLDLAETAKGSDRDLLDRLERAMDALVPDPGQRRAPSPVGSYICPLCGGPKSFYATACRKHNRGTSGNVGGNGGDTRSPEAVGRKYKVQTTSRAPADTVDVRELHPEDRQALVDALERNDAGAAQRIAIAVRPAPTEAFGLNLCPSCKKNKKPVAEPFCGKCVRVAAGNGHKR